MKFRGFYGENMEVVKTKDGGHDHLEIRKDGVVQWYLHIEDDKFSAFSTEAAIPMDERPTIRVTGGDHDMKTLSKEC